MKAYIREHFKIILAVTIVLVGTIVFFATSQLVAETTQEVPSVPELKVIDYDIKEDIYHYTGEPIESGINKIIVDDIENNRSILSKEDFVIEEYMNNTECGYADIKISINGYQGTVTLEDVFQIKPVQVQNLQITQVARDSVSLSWDATPGVQGYYLYKSIDYGNTYAPIKVYDVNEALTYQDLEVTSNTTYFYVVRSFVTLDNEIIYGESSEPVNQHTPLDMPVLTKVSNVSYNSVKVQWNAVPGAVGYEVYRSLKKDGDYSRIAEITDGAATSYTDGTCECGITYFYYIKAAQAVDDGKVYGDASGVMSAKTTPNRVGISGVTGDNDTKVTLNWSKSVGAQGYEIYRSQSSKSNYQLVATIASADTLTWSESGLHKSEVYYYKLRPYCIVNGAKVTGSYSGTYEKEITIVYEEVSGDISALRQYAGRPYVYGGTSFNGWDCSGFTQYVFKKHFGISLSRTAASQAGGGKAVSVSNRSAWQPGDLLFYRGESGYISHVAIYLGNGQMIHALNSKYDTLVQGVSYYESWDPNTTLVSVRRYFK